MARKRGHSSISVVKLEDGQISSSTDPDPINPTNPDPLGDALMGWEPETTPPSPPVSEVTKKSKRSGTVAEWYKHRRKTINENPSLNAVEQVILAKKTYNPTNGLLKSAVAIHKEAFLLRHPAHGMEKKELELAIRNDLLARI